MTGVTTKTMRILASTMLVMIAAIAKASPFCFAEALSSAAITDAPPLLDVPVWSMATLNDDGGDGNSGPTTNMNLLTYATPVAIRPNRLYALGLYKETKSRDNFLREKSCVLQLLSADQQKHIDCVRLLGVTSGKDISKEETLRSEHGIELQELSSDTAEPSEGLPKVLPGCVRYLKLSMVGDDVTEYDGGENCHDVVVCKVDKMWTDNDGEHLSTGALRKLGLITEQGRIAPLPEDE